MGIPVLILGESGTGKSCSMRNLDSSKTVLIQAVSKPLPFKNTFLKRSNENPNGTLMVSDNSVFMIDAMNHYAQSGAKTIVIDDFQYVMANEFMRRSQETGFTKFTDIARHAWEIITAAQNLPDDVKVYFLSHVQSDDQGVTKAKTIGKLLDEKITVEGLFTIVLRTNVEDGKYRFSTQNSGNDTVKSPMGLFDAQYIENDLQEINNKISEYY
tara:strand:- start:96 stop:734 length:639 start_codon:yes stop_codon:yes gene_type:complete